MKAIIVDDEKHVREGLLLLADWNALGIETVLQAADGNEAMQLITAHHPEIIFTDMNMPRMDGVELLKWIASNNFQAKTIVISGYDDFKYTRNAIAYGGFDYLLKPIDQEDLHETLSRAIKEWNEQYASKQSNFAVWDNILSGSLTQDNLSKQTEMQLKKELKLAIPPSKYQIAIIPMKMFIQRINNPYTTVLTVCNKLLRTTKAGIAFRNLNKDEQVIVLLWSGHQHHHILKQILADMKRDLNVYSSVVVAKPSAMLKESYSEALTLLGKQNLLEETSLMDAAKIVKQPALISLFDYADDMKWAFQRASIEAIDRMLTEIFSVFQKQAFFSLEQLELWEKQFDILKDHWLKEYGLPDQDDFNQGLHYWSVNGSFSLELFQKEKRAQFHHLFKIIEEVKFQKEKSSVQLIEEFVRSNYQKDIKLQEIADRFFLSREYISRKFKQEYHETITDYVTKIRIERAKALLENPYLKIYEVAEAVGYPNDKYFIKLFKKLVGVTPTEYKNNLAQK